MSGYLSKVHDLFLIVVETSFLPSHVCNYAYGDLDSAKKMLESPWSSRTSVLVNCKLLKGNFAVTRENIGHGYLIMPGEGFIPDMVKTFTSEDVVKGRMS